MGDPAERHRTPAEQLPDGRWTPGTLVRTPTGQRAQVLPYDTQLPAKGHGDSVFIQPLCHPERPWQLWSSSELAPLTDEHPGHHSEP